ncbi:ribosomal RNA large subunit methyltransferase E-like [Lycorma delicatula]|uniref:ribosomal RNA large subunit methyltransferase E-like n=1 Tax=Lycorma delicatula TaxID=130591 RepID=UPI003F5112FD
MISRHLTSEWQITSLPVLLLALLRVAICELQFLPNVPSKMGLEVNLLPLKLQKKHKNSSKQWLTRQLNDPYVSKAKLDGYRSRSAYKLLEIHEKFNLLKPGMKLVDLGAAPGGWSQVASKIINSDESSGNNSTIIAIDLLDIEPIII